MPDPQPDWHFDDGRVVPALAAMEQDRDSLDTAWRNAVGVIWAAQAGIGGPDTLSRAFTGGYQNRADAMGPEVGKRLTEYGQLAAAGRDCVAIYARGEGAATIPFVTIE